MFHTRLLDSRTKTNSFKFAGAANAIQRIYVINLDRKPDRWSQISRELRRIHMQSGESLFSITRRFSAVDARYLCKEVDKNILNTYYSLADQLYVEPNPRISMDAQSRAIQIKMTPQEVAIALSHIEVWKLIANGDTPYTLVLEDDSYFQRGFCRDLDKIWHAAIHQGIKEPPFDLLYLSFHETDSISSSKIKPTKLVRKPDRGIWWASGYVLSQSGAKKLIQLLPAYGPIDLWLNLKFGMLNTLIAHRSVIEQRVDFPSTNSYSVMPILSQIGIYTREKPLVARVKKLPGPIFAYGEPGSGLTALATALSMLGYTCCNDITELPSQEHDKIFAKKRGRKFNAYVNIGSFSPRLLAKIMKTYPRALLIFTTSDDKQTTPAVRDRILYLPHENPDKWAVLSLFLGCAYPAFRYPTCEDVGQRRLSKNSNKSNKLSSYEQLDFDVSPWVLPSKKWNGVPIDVTNQDDMPKSKTIRLLSGDKGIDDKHWRIRDDTFPSNLALFTPDNIEINDSGIMILTLREQNTSVRSFTSAAIVTQQRFKYGKFSAEIRPTNVSGLITGIFLHRNSPHQEIDIEFLGNDTTKMLVNVFYNPGIEGTKLEYGYRGTPALIDLGFDAAENFHKYEIEWHSHLIRWRVDERIVYERVLWNPTPIPNLPMEFNVNLWHSRSKKLAGNLDNSKIPAQTEVRSIQVSR